MKKAFTLVEAMIITAILGLIAAIAIPLFVEAKNKKTMENMTPEQFNEKQKERLQIKKICEIDGYNIWAISGMHCVAIPIPISKTNSITLERP